jgi:hypothetical protein
MIANRVKGTWIIFMLFSPWLAMAEEAVPGAVPVLEQHQVCSADSECVLVQRHCGDCDCGTPVNNQYYQSYIKEKMNRCANYKGGICDLTGPTNTSVCRSGKCVTK